LFFDGEKLKSKNRIETGKGECKTDVYILTLNDKIGRKEKIIKKFHKTK
jgi:hypothetical protein